MALCTDSSSLLPPAAAASLGVDVVPAPVLLDDEPFDETMSSLDWFYERLRAGAVATATEPSPADFVEAYERAAARGALSIASVHDDARASGTVAAAQTAAHRSPIPVTVVDTKTAGFGVAVSVRAAAEAVARNDSAAGAALAASQMGRRVQSAYVVRGSPGARVPTVGGWMLFRFAEGAATPIWECGSEGEAIERIASLVLRRRRPVAAAVGHAGRALEATADLLAHRLAAEAPVVGVERYRVGASLGAHTGAESFGAFWWPTRP